MGLYGVKMWEGGVLVQLEPLIWLYGEDWVGFGFLGGGAGFFWELGYMVDERFFGGEGDVQARGEMVNMLTFRLQIVSRRSIVQFVDFSLYPFWAMPIFEKKIQFLLSMANIKLFHDQKVREVWREKNQRWFFVLFDVVSFFTESSDPKQDSLLNSNWGTICTPLPMIAKVESGRLGEIEDSEPATK